MKQTHGELFQGLYTALITPFTRGGTSVDTRQFRRLIDHQIDAGVDGIVVCGTTGESPTVTHREQRRLIDIAVKHANQRTHIIASAGSNCTKESIELARAAKTAGADGIMLVNPYYNRPPQEGLYRHFSAVAQAAGLPTMLYNIPGRTGVNLELATLERLLTSNHNIVAIKEASGSLDQIRATIKTVGNRCAVLSGDDNLTYDVMTSGGRGVVSVASNLIPQRMVPWMRHMQQQNVEAAQLFAIKYETLFKTMFLTTNPIPIKYMMHVAGLTRSCDYRLPLCEMNDEQKAQCRFAMRQFDITIINS